MRRNPIVSVCCAATVLIVLSCSGDSLSSDLPIPVEREASFPVWLPAPGSSRQVPLSPAAEKARERGLSAARAGDWPKAIAAFKEARESAHCAPSLMYNLGLAHERAGEAVAAALWYRAYLSAVPDAANAAEVRAETEVLVARTKAKALRMWEEAERLADTLPATPLKQGAKSLRQAALESIASYQYMAGMTERADALARRAQSLPGAGNPRSYWDKHGVYAAVMSWDADRVNRILKRWGPSYGERGQYLKYVAGMRGESTEARRLITSDSPAGYFDPPGLAETRGYEPLEIVHMRSMEKARAFDEDWFTGTLVPQIELSFWDGRPDVALRLARRARAYFEKFDVGYNLAYAREPYTVLVALSGDREGMETAIRRFRFTDGPETMKYRKGLRMAVGRIALALAAIVPSADAVALIEGLIRNVEYNYFDGTLHGDVLERAIPLPHFARWVAAGQPDRALKVLDDLIAASGYGSPGPGVDRTTQGKRAYCKESLERALRFAVATGRTDLALKLADRLSRNSTLRLVSLNRIALASGSDIRIRARVDAYIDAACGGWRPRDAAQAWDTWRRIRYADQVDEDEGYVYGTRAMEESAKLATDKPETVPGNLALRATLLWIGSMGARERF